MRVAFGKLEPQVRNWRGANVNGHFESSGLFVLDNVVPVGCLTGDVPEAIEGQVRRCLSTVSSYLGTLTSIPPKKRPPGLENVSFGLAREITVYMEKPDDWSRVRELMEPFWRGEATENQCGPFAGLIDKIAFQVVPARFAFSGVKIELEVRYDLTCECDEETNPT